MYYLKDNATIRLANPLPGKIDDNMKAVIKAFGKRDTMTVRELLDALGGEAPRRVFRRAWRKDLMEMWVPAA